MMDKRNIGLGRRRCVYGVEDGDIFVLGKGFHSDRIGIGSKTPLRLGRGLMESSLKKEVR